MSLEETGREGAFREIDAWDDGIGWMAHPEETMQRASHALEVDGDVWVIDPVDADGLDARLADLGAVAGVVVLLDRHKRDADTVADRHDVPVYVPDWMSGVAPALDAPVERPDTGLPGTDYELRKLIDNPFWQEAILYDPDGGTLVVPEAVGTAGYFLVGGERLGVHPMLRLLPPRSLGRLAPDRLRVGHGAGVAEDPAGALRDALVGARRRTPALYAKNLRTLLFD